MSENPAVTGDPRRGALEDALPPLEPRFEGFGGAPGRADPTVSSLAAGARYKAMSPARLPITRSPCVTIPPGFSPSALLESPVLLTDIKMAASAEDDNPGVQDGSSEDEDYQYVDSSDHEMNSPGNVLGRKGQPPRKRSRDFTEKLPLMEGEGKSFRVVGFNQNQRNMFLQILMRFGFGKFDWKEFIPRLEVKSPEEIHAYGALFMRHVTEEATESQNFSDGVPKEGLRVDEVLIRIANIQLIEEKVEFASKNPGVTLFFEDLIACFPGLRGKNWKDEHDLLLLKAILKHGYARWQTMIEDKELGLADVIQLVLNLPPVNGYVTRDVPMPDGSSSSHTANGGTEANKGSQPNTDYPAQYQIREQHRRLVDFIKKRYLLLEKALNAEYCLAQIGYTRPPESGKQDPEAEHDNTEMPLSVSLIKGLFVLEPITAEEVVYDNKPGCLEMARLYNRMLRVVDDNAVDAVKAHMGDVSAGFLLCNSLCQIEAIYDGMQRILTGPEISSAAAAAAQAKTEERNGSLPKGDMRREVMTESAPASQASREHVQPNVAKGEDSTVMYSRLNGSSTEGKDVEMIEARVD